MCHTGYKAASGQVHFPAFDMKMPYSYQTTTSIQNILRILTTGRRRIKDGICAMNPSRACPSVKGLLSRTGIGRDLCAL